MELEMLYHEGKRKEIISEADRQDKELLKKALVDAGKPQDYQSEIVTKKEMKVFYIYEVNRHETKLSILPMEKKTGYEKLQLMIGNPLNGKKWMSFKNTAEIIQAHNGYAMMMKKENKDYPLNLI